MQTLAFFILCLHVAKLYAILNLIEKRYTMALTRIVGDIHGLFNDYKAHALHDFEGPHIQIGDFGVGFGQSDYWHESVDAYMCASNGRFIRGNHDKPAQCHEMRSWIPDGTVQNDVMYIGGAWSIDNPNAPPGWYKRTANVDWWADEECSEQQFAVFADIYDLVRPRVLITHDCPHRIATEMFWSSGLLSGPRYNTRTGDFLQRLQDIHQPELHFFGHWHESMSYRSGRTHFQCIGILDYVDVEL